MLIGLIISGVASFIYLIIRWAGDGCQDFETVTNFNVDLYMGTWYEYARTENIPFEDGDCITADYKLDGGHVKVTNTEYIRSADRLDSASGKAFCSKFNDGMCGVKFNFFQPMGKYDVVSTDYTSYAIVYSCSHFLAGAFCLEYLWILARTTYEKDSADQVAFQLMVDEKLKEALPDFDHSSLKLTSQDASTCKWTNPPPAA